MGARKNLLKLFTEDSTYNYHIIKTDEPAGHLVYLIKNGSPINADTLEFTQTKIAEELIKECEVDIEKFAPAIYFTEEANPEKLKYKLNDKLAEDTEFSEFIETIKDEYRILEVKDSLLFKKDPQAYEASKQAEHEEKQKGMWDEMIEQMTEQRKRREDTILAYNNDLIKLLQDYLEGIVEYENRDIKLEAELEKIVGNLVDPETWIKINDNPFVCRIEVISLEKDKMNVFLTDNNDYQYTATLRFDKTVLVTENIIRINKGEEFPITKMDYEVLAELFSVDTQSVKDWDFKNDTDRFEYVIDYLVPIFKENKKKKEEELLAKFQAEHPDEEDENEEEEKEIDEEENDNNNLNLNMAPSNYMFNVMIPEDPSWGPSAISLVEIEFWNQNHILDDSLGSHNLSANVINALNNAEICGEAELMESIWEVTNEQLTEQQIINNMTSQGFIYNPNI